MTPGQALTDRIEALTAGQARSALHFLAGYTGHGTLLAVDLAEQYAALDDDGEDDDEPEVVMYAGAPLYQDACPVCGDRTLVRDDGHCWNTELCDQRRQAGAA